MKPPEVPLKRARSPITPPPRPAGGVVHVNVPRCKGCELCIEVCPTKVLTLSDDYNAAGYHYPVWSGEGCIDCNACHTICPEYAIFATPALEPVSVGA